MAPLYFPKLLYIKLNHNVHSKVTLISAKFGADLVTISKDTDHKTKWPLGPVFWPTRYRGGFRSRWVDFVDFAL